MLVGPILLEEEWGLAFVDGGGILVGGMVVGEPEEEAGQGGGAVVLGGSKPKLTGPQTWLRSKL